MLLRSPSFSFSFFSSSLACCLPLQQKRRWIKALALSPRLLFLLSFSFIPQLTAALFPTEFIQHQYQLQDTAHPTTWFHSPNTQFWFSCKNHSYNFVCSDILLITCLYQFYNGPVSLIVSWGCCLWYFVDIYDYDQFSGIPFNVYQLLCVSLVFYHGRYVCVSHIESVSGTRCSFVTFWGRHHRQPCVCPITYVFWSVSVSLCVRPAFEHWLVLWKALYQPPRSAETLCSTQKISGSFVSNIAYHC